MEHKPDIYLVTTQNTPNDDFLVALGLVAFHWATIDIVLDSLRMLILKSNGKPMEVLQGNLTTGRRIELLGKLSKAEVNDDHLQAELDNLLTALSALARKRNAYMHSTWWMGHTSGDLFSATLDQLYKKVPSPVTPQLLRDLAAEIQEVTLGLGALSVDLLPRNTASPGAGQTDR